MNRKKKIRNKSPYFPVLNETIQAVRSLDNGVQFEWQNTTVFLNSSGFRMINLLDGSTSVEDLANQEKWDFGVTKDLIDDFVRIGLVTYLNKPIPRINRGWIKTSQLISSSIEIIQQCNQNCLRCYLIENESKTQQLSLSELDNIFVDLVSYGISSICISGGEPFLHKDLYDIVCLANNSGLQVAIATNGTLLTPDVLKTLKRIGVRLLQISVDGLEKTHDHIRQSPGAFKALEEVFLNCAKNCIDAYAITSINKENVKEILPLNQTLATWKVKRHMLARYVPTGVADDNFGIAQREDFISTMNELSNAMFTPVISCDPLINRLLAREYICGAGYYGISISANGFVKICDTLPQFIGNIRENKFGNIIENSPLIHQIITRNQEYQCNPSSFDKCRFGCLAYQYVFSESIDGQDPYYGNSSSYSYISKKARPIGNDKVPYVKT